MSLIEKYVTQWLPQANVEFLNALCTEYGINIPAAKIGKQQEILKLVNRHLFSAELEATPDHGQAVFTKLFNELGVELGKGTPKEEPGEPQGARAGNLTYHKLKELKIHGVVDGGKDGTLTYTSLSCQLKQAEVAGYSTPEMISAVMHAVPAGKKFRALLESKMKIGLEKEDFLKLLRSHFKEQDSGAVLQLLMNCYQEAGQDAHEFCCMAMALRDRVLVLSEEEGNPEDEEVLNRRLYHTIFTGLKQNGIRMELQADIKAANLPDIEFLEKVSKAEANEKERLGKVKVKADVAALTEKSMSSGGSSADSGGGKKQGKNASGQQPQAQNKQKANCSCVQSACPQPQNVVHTDKIDLLVSKIDSLHTFSQEQAKKVSALENKLSAPNHATATPFGVLNPVQMNNNNMPFRVGPTFVPDGRRFLGNNGNKVVFKCETRVANNVPFCNHCFKCGETGHKKLECPN